MESRGWLYGILVTVLAFLFGYSAPAYGAAGAASGWSAVDNPEYASTGHAVAQTSDGGWVMAGSKDRVMHVKKVDGKGRVEWEQYLYNGLAGFSIMETEDGGFLAAGQTRFLSDEEGVQAYMVKLDQEGMMEWEQMYGGKGFDKISSVVEVPEGYLLDGTLMNENKRILLVTDKEGTVLKQLDLSPYFKKSEGYSPAVIKTEDGGFIVTGGNDKLLSGNGIIYGTRIVKLNADYTKQWAKDLKGSILDGAAAGNGDVLLSMRGTQGSLLVYRLDAQKGTIYWEKGFSSPKPKSYYKINGYKIISTLDGGALVAGDLSGSSTQIAYMLKLSAAGAKEWEQTFYSNNSWFTGAAAADGRGEYLLTGHTYPLGTDKPKSFMLQVMTGELPPVQVWLDEQKLELSQDPLVISNTTMLPVRDIFEALGASVTYQSSTKTIRAVKGERTVTMSLGSKQATIETGQQIEKVALTVPAQAIRGVTVVPLRFVGEAFGNEIRWNGKTRIATIVTGA
ncbi:copper amine oxidase N-terminal domain-containing protein [Paenibacillus tarimensis]|uniref:copper amine oxidase N-terminal domain-containing protein n=1 Tax=Paenibacillus tarimensis TaxID=416012 RepID=UPI001F3C0862|nr:copper amine oxidase N-terminal domain-containing protein [Paenibacillus tarimensis]MCF2943078.1 copper amine oxidase N-terminal domain-containing protein [Paenibacillus tarimensis]